MGEKKVPTLVVQYERLHTDLYTELKRMVDFLGVPYTESDLQCAINSSLDTFHQRHHETTDPYTKKQQELILQKIQLIKYYSFIIYLIIYLIEVTTVFSIVMHKVLYK